MNVGDLKKILNQFPDDMDIWVSDFGLGEGGSRINKVESVLAYNASLDGDEVDDEYIYEEDLIENGEDPEEFLSKGYTRLSESSFNLGPVLSKTILFIS